MAWVAVTGACGFVGRALIQRLEAEGHHARAIVRSARVHQPLSCDIVEVGDLTEARNLESTVAGVDVVMHLAARTHIPASVAGGLDAFRPVNVGVTARLAQAASAAGVKRFVLVSSIKVNGEATDRHPYRADDVPAPEDAYGWSKWEAEQALTEIGTRTGIETVVVRPPLVYGAGARGNFQRLREAVRRRTPLPLGAVRNRRSLVAVDNLVDLLALCVVHPTAAGRTLLVSDGEDVSTPELIRRLGNAMGTLPRLVPVPVAALRLAGRLSGRGAEIRRLCGSLQVDIGPTRSALAWNPPVSVDEGLRRAVTGG